jgi:hypothetical protein
MSWKPTEFLVHETNAATRKTRACTIDALDEESKAAIRAHGTKFELKDIEPTF